jgi:hypothetical protein
VFFVIDWRHPTEDDYEEYGAVMIDATQPVDMVIDTALASVNS